MKKLNTSVLFVDDDKLTRFTYGKILSKIVDSFYIAKNGKDGIAQFIKFQPDIIIADIQMPDMNGLDMIRKIKKYNPAAKTIIATAFNEVNYFLEAIDIGVSGYLLKPIDNKKLVNLLDELSDTEISESDDLKEIRKRKRAEEALKETEQLFHSIIRYTHDLIFIYSGDKILFVNPKVIEVTGFKESEIYTYPIWNIIHSDDRTRFMNIEKRRAIGDDIPNMIETNLVSRDGHVKYVEVAFSEIEYRGKSSVLGIARDITDRKKAEGALVKSQERLKYALDAANDGIWDWNLLSNEVYFSPSYMRMLGYKPNELEAKFETWQKLLHPDDRQDAEALLKRYIEGKSKDFEIEFRLKTKSGLWKWILGRGKIVGLDENGNPVRMVGTHLDLTERKASESKLQESEKRYRTLFESASDAIFIHSPEGNFLEVNNIACKRLGYSKEELLKKRTWEIDASSPEKLKKEGRKILKSGKSSFFETIQIGKRGKRIKTEVNSIIIDYQDRKAILSIARDITQRVKDRENLLKSLKEKEILLKEVHHRVKNNMQVISSILNLQSKTVKNPVIRGYLEESQERIRSMALVHENLYKTRNLAEVNFADYVKTLTDNLYRSYGVEKSKTQLKIDISSDLFLSLEVGIPCGLIIHELVSNAFKYAFPKGNKGLIEVIMIKNRGKSLLLTVKDNGIGMEKIDIYNTETLGLQLVSTLVDQLNGKIKIKIEKGTEFSIIFSV